MGMLEIRSNNPIAIQKNFRGSLEIDAMLNKIARLFFRIEFIF